MKSLTQGEQGILSILADKLRELGAEEILLYGSAARGNMNEGSDIDLLVVFPEVTWELEKDINDLCFYAGLECDRVISTVCFSTEELEKTPLRVSPMVLNARREGVLL